VIADDELEERITLALEGDKQIDLASLGITVRDGEDHVDGSIDGEDDRRHLIGSIRAVRGVRNVHARELLTRGVDSHIPSDSEE
jgi:osmotically-inducible protein OsmY